MSDVRKGTTSRSEYFNVVEKTAGTAKTGVTIAQFLIGYTRTREGPVTTVASALPNTSAAYSSGGAIEIDATNLPGLYRADVPNAAYSSNANVDAVIVSLTAATTTLSVAPAFKEVSLVVNTPSDAYSLIAGGVTAVTVIGNVGGSVGSVVGNVGGSVNSVATSVLASSVTGNVGGSVGSVLGNVVGSVASVVGNVGGSVGSVIAAVLANSVTGNVGGSVGSVVGGVGGAVASVVGNVGGSVNSVATTVSANVTAFNGDATAAANIAKTTRAIGRGTVTAGASTTSIPTSAFTPNGGAADQFKGRIITFDADTTTSALRGQSTDITASTNAAAPTFTVTALTTAPSSGDLFSVT
jgi:hypothetical protein